MNLTNTSFDDLFGINGVLGILIVSPERNILFQDLTNLGLNNINETDLEIPFLLLDGVREVDLLFERYRIYIRKCPVGYFWVIMAPDASAAMIRLQCDIIAPKMSLKKQTKRGISRLFK